MSVFGAFHVRKNTRLSMPDKLKCSRSRAWEPGNEASLYHSCCYDFINFNTIND